MEAGMECTTRSTRPRHAREATADGRAAAAASHPPLRVLRSLPTPQQTPVIYIPASVGLAAGLQLVERGRHVLYGTKGAKAEAEAKALNCAFILREAGGMPEKL